MILKKDLIVAILATFCITAILFTAIPIRSAPTPAEYDPWIDTNDDGIINYEDLFNLASRYGTFGTSINKTDLLLELQSKIDSLNDTVISLTERIDALEAPESVTTDRIADGAVTNEKLAAKAIPSASVKGITTTTTTSTGGVWEDMDAMSVTITFNQTSHVLIVFTLMASTVPAGNNIRLRALVGAQPALPAEYQLLCDSTAYDTWSCSFYKPSVTSGTYTVKIQWWVSGGMGYAHIRRVLTVIALPG